MSESKLSAVLTSHQSEILTAWIEQQTSASTYRQDLISEDELRLDSGHFLALISEAVASGQTDIRGPEYQPLLERLTVISQSRGRKGFSPSETASFVFSFKQPLFTALRSAHGNDAAGLGDDIWLATTLLDNLGLHTAEIYLQTREDIINRQQEEMLELSTPVVQLWDGIVALPLIGTLDSARTNIVMESLLQTVVATRSEIAIIDITGVPTVDTLVAQHLLKTVAAARLMGVECIISGIRPQIAQTMVHLQIDLSAVTTKASMADALRTALRKGGYTLTRTAPKTTVVA